MYFDSHATGGGAEVCSPGKIITDSRVGKVSFSSAFWGLL